mgnify:CR=1 FL=1
MARILLLGAGGVANVIAMKVAQVPEVFSSLCIASRTRERCQVIADRIAGALPVSTAGVDAGEPAAVAALIRQEQARIVLNAALPGGSPVVLSKKRTRIAECRSKTD